MLIARGYQSIPWRRTLSSSLRSGSCLARLRRVGLAGAPAIRKSNGLDSTLVAQWRRMWRPNGLRSAPMERNKVLVSVAGAVLLGAIATGAAIPTQDKYTVKVRGGLAFSDF